MTVVIVIMSVGVLFGRKPVQGSCGGMNNIDGLNECEVCGETSQNGFLDCIEEPKPSRSMFRNALEKQL